MNNEKNLIIRSSAAEYLTFIAANGDDENSIEMRYENENIWLTQKMLATLYDVSVSAINQHIKKIYDDSELEPRATIKKYLIVQKEGSRDVSRNVDHYNLQVVIAVGLGIATGYIPASRRPGCTDGCWQNLGSYRQDPRRKRI